MSKPKLITPLYTAFYKVCQQGLDILFPPSCAGCQRSGALLCFDFLQSMQPQTLSIPPNRSLRPLSPPEPRAGGQKNQPVLHGLYSVHLHQGPLRRAIHQLKYEGQKRLAEPLGLLLAQAFLYYNLQADAIVPLPLHAQRQRERGYNQAHLLARICAAHLKLPDLEQLVIRQRATRAQVGLSARERQQNVLGAFTLTPGQQACSGTYPRIVLIDDVATTGATLAACAEPLYLAGVKEVRGLVLAQPGDQIQDACKLML